MRITDFLLFLSTMKKNLKTVLKILSDGNFHSGSNLGKALQVTRGAIWKSLKKLGDYGIKLEAKTNLGYRINGGLELLDKKLICKYLDNKYRSLESQMVILDEVPSTNTYLVEQTKQQRNKKPGVSICFAECQTAGRGRMERSWFSPYSRNIYLSILVHFDKDISKLGGFSLAIAVGIIEALQSYGIADTVFLKWPNDLIWQNKKLAGILVDLFGEANGGCYAVIGVGLNVKMSPNPEIDQPWCDVAGILHKDPERNKLAGLLLNSLISVVEVFKLSGLQPFCARWRSLDINYGKKITLTSANKKVTGIGCGIDGDGSLLLKTCDGEVRRFVSGEVSLRC